jgi:toxin FitB
VIAWIAAHQDELYLRVLVTGEIRRGIESIRKRDPRAAASLEGWLREIETTFEDRILPVHGAVADRWGRLMADRTLPAIDGLLAATALLHGLTLATRNVRDVVKSGVSSVRPVHGRSAFLVATAQTPSVGRLGLPRPSAHPIALDALAARRMVRYVPPLAGPGG